MPLRSSLLIAWAAFCTSLAQLKTLGRLPTLTFLKEELGLSQDEVALFFLCSGVAWYLKPVVGVLTDGVPLFGSRRRSYLVLGAALAAVGWVAMGIVGQLHGPLPLLLVCGVLMNLALVFPSTVLGGWMVEVGQRHDAAGRVGAVRQAAQGVAVLVTPLAGGLLAGVGYGWTAGIAAVTLLSLAIAGTTAQESPAQPASPGRASRQVRALLTNGPALAAAGMMLLVHLSPGLHTAMVFRQRDVYGFSTATIGALGSLEGAAGLGAALVYAAWCRRGTLAGRIAFGLAASGVVTLTLLVYSATTAPAIHVALAFFGVLAELALMELAVASTPTGSEALGFALMMSLRNAGNEVSDVFGSWLMERHDLSFATMVWANAATTLLGLGALVALPRVGKTAATA